MPAQLYDEPCIRIATNEKEDYKQRHRQKKQYLFKQI